MGFYSIFSSMMEFAPVHAGLVFAISNTVSNLSGFLAPISKTYYRYKKYNKVDRKSNNMCFFHFSNWKTNKWREYRIRMATCILDFCNNQCARIDSFSNFWNRRNTIMGAIIYFVFSQLIPTRGNWISINCIRDRP